MIFDSCSEYLVFFFPSLIYVCTGLAHTLHLVATLIMTYSMYSIQTGKREEYLTWRFCRCGLCPSGTFDKPLRTAYKCEHGA